MISSHKFLTLAVAFLLLVAAASASVMLGDSSTADANNPPSTLLGTVGIDPGDDPNVSDPSPVWAVVEANGRYYIGGQFTEVGGETQAHLAAIEVATGRLDPAFRPVIAGSTTEVLALAISPDGNSLYIGGRFTTVDGAFRDRIAKLDAFTGAVDPLFDPDANAVVETIAVDTTGVYVGGSFATIGGGTSPNLAKLDSSTGALDPTWTATADGKVFDLEFLGGDIFVGGNFQNVNGAAHPYLVRLTTANGAVSAGWNTNLPVPQKVLSIAPSPDGSMVYAGTAGTPSQLGNTVWAYTTAGTRTWQKVNAGDVQAIEATDDAIYVGTHGQWVYTEAKFLLDGVTPNPSFPTDGYVEGPQNANASQREKFFALDPSTGDLLPWDPNGSSVNGVWELELGPSGLLAGGDFMEIDNPTGVPGADDTIFSPHFAVFPNIGSLDAAPEPLFTFDCAGTSCNFDASLATDDGNIASYSWDFGNGATATGIAATETLANDQTHTVTLTVTDDVGQRAQHQEKVIVGTGGLPVTLISTASLNQTSNLFVQQLPVLAQTNDTALAFLSVNDPAVTATAPAGWVFVGDQTNNNVRTFIWRRALNTTEPGTNAAFSLSSSTKADLTIAVFRGVDGATPIAAVDATGEALQRVGHRAPALSFTGEATILHYWADRSSENTELSAPGNDAVLSTSIGSGAAYISSLLSVREPAISDGSPQAVAVAEHHGRSAIGWSIALTAGPGVNDTTPPETVITTPAAGSTAPGDPLTITGTATDNIEVASVKVRLVRDNDPTPARAWQYFNGTTWTTTLVWHPATVDTQTGNWNLDINIDPEPDVWVQALATDTSGNEDPTRASNFIDIGSNDTTPPETAITTPAAGSTAPGDPLTITGTATDNIEVASVKVRLVRDNDPTPARAWQYFNGTTWTTTLVWHPATVDTQTGNWNLDINIDPEPDVWVQALATDTSGNEDPTRASNFIDIGSNDTTPPETAITTPAAGSTAPGDPLTITGTATDNIEVASVKVRYVRDADPGSARSWQYWDGTTWQTSQTWFITPVDTNGSWTIDNIIDPNIGNPQPGIWAQAVAIDTSGNEDPTRASNFIYVSNDAEAPETVITTPAAGSTAPGDPLTITGTATDNIEVASVKVRLVRDNDPTPARAWQYFNGTTWTTTLVWHPATVDTQTGNWNLDINIDPEPDVWVQALATDTSGNEDPTRASNFIDIS